MSGVRLTVAALISCPISSSRRRMKRMIEPSNMSVISHMVAKEEPCRHQQQPVQPSCIDTFNPANKVAQCHLL